MKTLARLVIASSLLLGGCATTIRSDVTTFQQWPAELQDKTYVFEPPAKADDTLEYRNYQGLVGGELAKLGFRPAAQPDAAKLKVALHFSTIDRPTRVLQTNDPYFMGPPFWGPRGYWAHGVYRPFWGAYRYGGFGPYYDMWATGPLEIQEVIRHQYERQLRVTIDSVSGQKLFDVTVQNTSRRQSTPDVMPALVQSAFTGFPGENGKARRVDLKIE
ncbi:MAG: DUF4136 domain-containing protein [Pseudomonadota bacterium]